MEGSFKVKNYPMIAGFILGNLWILHLIFFGDAPDLAWAKDLSKAIPAAVAATILAVAISELISGEAKAVLVFRKRRNPLPGSRAFSEFGPKDPRVNMNVIASRYGNPSLPVLPDEQNKLWYKILKLNESRPSVGYAHQYYLLMRDLTFVTVLLGIATIIFAVATHASMHVCLIVGAMLLGELLLAMRSATSLAYDLVRNALAEESAKP